MATNLSIQNCNSLQEEGFAKLVIRAYEEPNSPWLAQLGNMLDFRRISLGKNYEQNFQLANRVTGIELPDWDALLYSLDETVRGK